MTESHHRQAPWVEWSRPGSVVASPAAADALRQEVEQPQTPAGPCGRAPYAVVDGCCCGHNPEQDTSWTVAMSTYTFSASQRSNSLWVQQEQMLQVSSPAVGDIEVVSERDLEERHRCPTSHHTYVVAHPPKRLAHHSRSPRRARSRHTVMTCAISMSW